MFAYRKDVSSEDPQFGDDDLNDWPYVRGALVDVAGQKMRETLPFLLAFLVKKEPRICHGPRGFESTWSYAFKEENLAKVIDRGALRAILQKVDFKKADVSPDVYESYACAKRALGLTVEGEEA
jgi:hypothetical protein